MSNYILVWGSIVLTLSIGSTIALLVKMNGLQRRLKIEMKDLEKDLLDEINSIGQLDKTEPGRKLQELILSENSEHLYMTNSKERPISSTTLFFSKNSASFFFVIGLMATLALFYSNSLSFNGDQPLIEYLYVSVIVYFLTGIFMVAFSEPIYLWFQNNSLPTNNFLGKVLISYQSVKTNGVKAGLRDWGNCLVFNAGVSISWSTILVLGLALIALSISLIILIILLLLFMKK